MANPAYPSWSIYATPGEPDVPLISMVRAIDAKTHRTATEDDAREGDTEAIRRIARAAAGQGTNRSPGVVAHAARVLNEIAATHPEWIIAATPVKA